MPEREIPSNITHSDLPNVGIRVIDDQATPGRVARFLNAIRDRDGSLRNTLNIKAQIGDELSKCSDAVSQIVNHAREKDLDLVLLQQGGQMRLVFGKWLADHPEFVDIAAGAITSTIARETLGFVLRRHKRSLEQK